MAGRRKTAAVVPDCSPAQIQKVLHLRRAGLGFDVIAGQAGLADGDAARAVFDAAMSGVDTGFDVGLEISRLDALLAPLYAKAIKGDADAADRVLKIGERREALERLRRQRSNAGRLRRAFDTSVKDAAGVVDAARDAALIAAGRTIADQVDDAVAKGRPDEISKALYLLPHLNKVLGEMLATPRSRAEAGLAAAGDAGSSKTATVSKLREHARKAAG